MSNGPSLQTLHQSQMNCLKDHGVYTLEEFFAEAGGMYVNNPDGLKTVSLYVYNYIDSLYYMY